MFMINDKEVSCAEWFALADQSFVIRNGNGRVFKFELPSTDVMKKKKYCYGVFCGGANIEHELYESILFRMDKELVTGKYIWNIIAHLKK